jgi:predicted kinase
MRRTLIVTIGLPAAGKTTRALRWVAESPERRARVGSDEIAAMLHPQVIGADPATYGWHYALREQLVVNAAIEALLRSGVDVVCDDPFLLPYYLDTVRELAVRCDAELVIWDLTDVDVEECIARDEQRGRAGDRSVGEDVIRAQHRLLHETSAAGDRDLQGRPPPWVSGQAVPASGPRTSSPEPIRPTVLSRPRPLEELAELVPGWELLKVDGSCCAGMHGGIEPTASPALDGVDTVGCATVGATS